MSATATPPRVTPEDLLRMGSDGKRFELIDGKLIERTDHFYSRYVAGNVYSAIHDYVQPRFLGWVVTGGAGFQCFPDDPSKVRRADTSFIALDRLTAQQASTEGHLRIAPDLVVEVISPNDYAKTIKEPSGNNFPTF